VHFTHHGGSPPSGTPAAENGFRAFDYFSLDVQDENGDVVEGAIDSGYYVFEVDQSELEDGERPEQVALKHRVDGEWTTEVTELTSGADDDPLEYNGSISSFSTFAKATDIQAPTFSNTEPTGEITQTSPTIAADYEDNRELDTDSFTLTLDGDEVGDDTGTLTVEDDGFSYVPGTGLAEGSHEVTAEISDESGNTGEETWTFTISEAECPELAQLTNPQPADGATDVSLDTQVTIDVAEGSCAIASGELVVDGETVDASVEDGQLAGAIPDSVEAGDTVGVTATVADDAGNDQAREWSFTTAEDTTGPGGEDGDGGAMVWVIVALVVLAIVGVGAYFYSQQE
jgi:hypothetical protein